MTPRTSPAINLGPTGNCRGHTSFLAWPHLKNQTT
jgi:hypothetical protein